MKSRPLILFVACSLLPFLLAYAAVMSNWQPSDTTNKGELLSQEIVIPNWQANTNILWTIALAAPDSCAEVCHLQHSRLNNMYQALGKKQTKVDLVVLGSVENSEFSLMPEVSALKAGWLYLVDHHGLVVLAYPYEESDEASRLTHKGLLKDLKKLLNYARSS